MKKSVIFKVCFGAFCILALSAYQIADYLTKEQMKKYAASIVWSYQWNQHKLKLEEITGNCLAGVIDTSFHSNSWPADYHKWIKGVVLKNRGAAMTWMSEEKMQEMLGYINDSAIGAKTSLASRDSLFNELKTEVNYYLGRLTKLQATTPAKRLAIFNEVAKISPRKKVYQLAEALYENAPYPDLVKSQTNLRTSLAGAGITLEKNCSDFYNVLFSRRSKQYDYLFSLLRWTTYIDGGKITETEITGWTGSTLKALIDDGVTFLKKTKKVIDAYKVQ